MNVIVLRMMNEASEHSAAALNALCRSLSCGMVKKLRTRLLRVYSFHIVEYD